MPDIKSVRIGTVKFPIRFMDEDDDGYGENFGEFSQSEGLFICPKQNPTMMASTIMHECLHAMHYIYHWQKRMTEEQMCENLEGPLIAFISDNPELIRVLVAAHKKNKKINISDEFHDDI